MVLQFRYHGHCQTSISLIGVLHEEKTSAAVDSLSASLNKGLWISDFRFFFSQEVSSYHIIFSRFQKMILAYHLKSQWSPTWSPWTRSGLISFVVFGTNMHLSVMYFRVHHQDPMKGKCTFYFHTRLSKIILLGFFLFQLWCDHNFRTLGSHLHVQANLRMFCTTRSSTQVF